jgi:hypothetical protein
MPTGAWKDEEEEEPPSSAELRRCEVTAALFHNALMA